MIPASVIDSIGLEHWKCHRINERAIGNLFQLAASRSIPVYWIIPPLSPPLQERRERTAVDEDYSRFAREISQKYPGVQVIDGRHSGYGNTEFADSTHLNGRGAVAFSHDVANVLLPAGNSPRWVDLPRFRERPMHGLGEDIDQSKVALDAQTIRR